jgi:hypothetical protein
MRVAEAFQGASLTCSDDAITITGEALGVLASPDAAGGAHGKIGCLVMRNAAGGLSSTPGRRDFYHLKEVSDIECPGQREL